MIGVYSEYTGFCDIDGCSKSVGDQSETRQAVIKAAEEAGWYVLGDDFSPRMLCPDHRGIADDADRAQDLVSDSEAG